MNQNYQTGTAKDAGIAGALGGGLFGAGALGLLGEAAPAVAAPGFDAAAAFAPTGAELGSVAPTAAEMASYGGPTAAMDTLAPGVSTAADIGSVAAPVADVASAASGVAAPGATPSALNASTASLFSGGASPLTAGTDLTGASGMGAPDQSWLDPALKALGVKDLGSAVAKYGPAAATVLAMFKNKNAGNTAQQQYNAVAAPTQAVENTLLSNFQKGQISGADAYAISQWTQSQKSAVDNYYAQAGLSNSSMHQQALQNVDIQAQGMQQQALQNVLKNGLQAAGVTNPELNAGITAGVNADNQAITTLQNFINSLAGLNTQTTKPNQPNTQTGTPG
jgi:hypothetical protein